MIWFGYICSDPFGVLGMGAFRDYIWNEHCLIAGHPGSYWMVLE